MVIEAARYPRGRVSYDSAMASFDLVVVGAGIVGLAHALAAARRGLRVAVVERDARASQASIRNFGFITVTGQSPAMRARALRSREIWASVAEEARIPVLQSGAIVIAQRDLALDVLEQFAAGPEGSECELWEAAELRRRLPMVREGVAGALYSPYERRVEPREALPRLAQWLAERHRVTFLWSTAALSLAGTTVRHAAGALEAGAVVVAPGADVRALFPDVARRIRLRYCKLQMLRLRPQPLAWRLPGVLMSDLSLCRYPGFAALPAAAALLARLRAEQPEHLRQGVHLIVAQGADGAVIVGDSHEEVPAHDPFSSAAIDELLLGELRALLDVPCIEVEERWLGFYPLADVHPVLSEALSQRGRLVTVTAGTGMSTAFALGEETIAELFA